MKFQQLLDRLPLNIALTFTAVIPTFRTAPPTGQNVCVAKLMTGLQTFVELLERYFFSGLWWNSKTANVFALAAAVFFVICFED